MIEANEQHIDLAIIGAGPAGMSAAVYASRGGLSTMFFGDETKSNLYKSHVISNYLGFTNNPSGKEIAELGIKHATQFGALHNKNEIVNISISDNQEEPFILKDNQEKIYHCKAIVLTTGQSYALSGIQNEKELTGHGVSWCVTCDGYFFKNKNLAIIGNSDYAAEEALQLTAFSDKVTILSHGKTFNISEGLQKELEKKGVVLKETPRLKKFVGSENLEQIEFADGSTMAFEGVFLAIGVAGVNVFSKTLGLETENNYLKVDADCKTSMPGIFAAGDCIGCPAQVAASVGTGCIAGLSAIKFLRKLDVYIQYN